jgi:photosystem II stability/assembly factor-like uncharacterized protein
VSSAPTLTLRLLDLGSSTTRRLRAKLSTMGRTLLSGVIVALLASTAVGCGSSTSTGPETSAPRIREAPPKAPGARPSRESTASRPASAAKPLRVGSAELVGPRSGWAADGRILEWTGDAGANWRDITPRGVKEFGDVHFLDSRHGWLATRGSFRSPKLGIYATDDGGRSWARAHVSGPRQFTISRTVISFPDRRDGWALVDHEHGSGVIEGGALYRTTDGGLRWRYESTTPTDGSILFTSARKGWVAGSGQAGERLFHTTDGGRDWTRVHFPPPAGTTAGRAPDYGLPLRLAGGRLVVPVLLNNEGEKDALGFGTTRIGLYSPAAGGWRLDHLVTLRGSISGSASGSVTALPPADVLVKDPGFEPLIRVDLAGEHASASKFVPQGLPGSWTLDFVDARHGIAVVRHPETASCRGCRTEGNLFFTDDGGRSWTRRPVGP